MVIQLADGRLLYAGKDVWCGSEINHTYLPYDMKENFAEPEPIQ